MPPEDSRQPSPCHIVQDVNGVEYDLNTLTETQKIHLSQLSIREDSLLEKLQGHIIVDGNCEIVGCHRLKEIKGKIQSLHGSVLIENNPRLEYAPPVEARRVVSFADCSSLKVLDKISADILIMNGTAVQEILENVRLGRSLVAERCPNLQVVMPSFDWDTAESISLKDSPVRCLSQDIPPYIVEEDVYNAVDILPPIGYRRGGKGSIRRLMCMDMPKPQQIVAARQHKRTYRLVDRLTHLFGTRII